MPFIPTTVLAQPSTSPILSLTTVINSAAVLALHSSPVSVVPAPGAGLFLNPVYMQVIYHFGTTPYSTSSGNLALGTTTSLPSGGWNTTPDSILTASVNEFRAIQTGTGVVALASFVNQPLILYDSVADPTTGDGSLTVNILYMVTSA